MPQKIGFLSPLATNQADEGVIYPTGHTADVLTASEPPSKNLLECALARVPIRYSHNPDNQALHVVISGGKRVKALHASFTIDPYSIFRLGCVVYPAIPPRNALEALLCCQEYNAHFRFGRFYLHIEEREGKSVGYLCCACSYIAEPEVQKRLFAKGNAKGGTSK